MPFVEERYEARVAVQVRPGSIEDNELVYLSTLLTAADNDCARPFRGGFWGGITFGYGRQNLSNIWEKRGEMRTLKKHTALGIRWSSPTQLLVQRLVAYLWESGRDPEFSSAYGRMC